MKSRILIPRLAYPPYLLQLKHSAITCLLMWGTLGFYSHLTAKSEKGLQLSHTFIFQPLEALDTPEYIILENKVPKDSKKVSISGLVVDKYENPIRGTTILVRAGNQKVVKGGGQVDKNGRFSIEMAKDSDPQLPYFVEIHNLEYESASVPIKGNISSEIGIQLARLEGSRDPSDNELTPEIPFHERFFKNLITPYQKLKGVLRIN